MGYLWLRLLLIVLISSGCSELSKLSPSWYTRYDWDAEKYFDDPAVVELCRAIQKRDLDEVRRLIAAGVDINAKGKGDITPLLWSFPEENRAVFECLLTNGADPNVRVTADPNTGARILPGDSVTTLSAVSAFDYFDLVMANGGDPDIANSRGYTLLQCVIKGEGGQKLERIKKVVEAGADLNKKDQSGVTAAIMAVAWGGQYKIALLLLESGAGTDIYIDNSNQKLIHVVVREQLKTPDVIRVPGYRELLQFLIDKGESVEAARSDLDRWKARSGLDPKVIKQLREAETAARLAKEAEARQNAQPQEKQ